MSEVLRMRVDQGMRYADQVRAEDKPIQNIRRYVALCLVRLAGIANFELETGVNDLPLNWYWISFVI